MTRILTNSDDTIATERDGLGRRALLKGAAAAVAATGFTANASLAASVMPLGQTGAPTRSTAPLPLGPLPGSRYPDSHLGNRPRRGHHRLGPPVFLPSRARWLLSA
ncbi:hypothetical protein ACVWWR_005889 [Bradyrhizobium sp. LM3.2]